MTLYCVTDTAAVGVGENTYAYRHFIKMYQIRYNNRESKTTQRCHFGQGHRVETPFRRLLMCIKGYFSYDFNLWPEKTRFQWLGGSGRTLHRRWGPLPAGCSEPVPTRFCPDCSLQPGRCVNALTSAPGFIALVDHVVRSHERRTCDLRRHQRSATLLYFETSVYQINYLLSKLPTNCVLFLISLAQQVACGHRYNLCSI